MRDRRKRCIRCRKLVPPPGIHTCAGHPTTASLFDEPPQYVPQTFKAALDDRRTRLISITAPHFCAALILSTETDHCVQAAPILRWAEGKPWAKLKPYFEGKGWGVYEHAT